MIDRTHTAYHCHTRFLVCMVKGDLSRGSQGTIIYEMENLGRALILVHWDTGISLLMFPDEIELEPEYLEQAASPIGE